MQIERGRLVRKLSTPIYRNLVDVFLANRGIVGLEERQALLKIRKPSFSELSAQLHGFLAEMGYRYAKYKVVFPEGITSRQLEDIFSAPGLPDLAFDVEKRELRVELTPLSRIKECSIIGDRVTIEGTQVTTRVRKALISAGLIIIGHNAPLDVFDNTKIIEIIDGPLILGTEFKGLENDIRKYVVQHLDQAIYEAIRILADTNEIFNDSLTVFVTKLVQTVAKGKAPASCEAIVDSILADDDRAYTLPNELMAALESQAKADKLAAKIFNSSYGDYITRARIERDNGCIAEAAISYLKAWESYPTAKLKEEIADCYYLWSKKIDINDGDWFEKIRKVLSFNPNHFAALAELCRAYLSADQFAEAIVYGERAKKQEPLIIWNNLNLAKAYFESYKTKKGQRQGLKDLAAAEKIYLSMKDPLRKKAAQYKAVDVAKKEEKQRIEQFYVDCLKDFALLCLEKKEFTKARNLADELEKVGRRQEALAIRTIIA